MRKLDVKIKLAEKNLRKFAEKKLVLGGWVGGWMDGWIPGCKSCFKDCLQTNLKPKNLGILYSHLVLKSISLRCLKRGHAIYLFSLIEMLQALWNR